MDANLLLTPSHSLSSRSHLSPITRILHNDSLAIRHSRPHWRRLNFNAEALQFNQSIAMALPMSHSLLHAVLACVLYDPPYRDRFHTLPCIKKICNEILAPDGMVLGKNTLKNAFKITGGGFYTQYFMDGLISDIGCPEGTIMAVRRVRRTNAEEGFFTCVGCFNKSSVPSEEDARRLDVGGDIVPRISTRGGLVNEIPHRIHGNFLMGYAKNVKKNYFVAKSAYSPTPVKRPRPVSSRPQARHLLNHLQNAAAKRRNNQHLHPANQTTKRGVC